MELIEIEKKRDKKILFHIVRMKFDSPGLFVITGESGCGKTTLLDIIFGADKEYSGNINDTKNMAYARHSSSFLNNLTLFEHMKITEINFELITYLELNDIINVKVKDLSGGQKIRLELLNALSSKSKIILIDEPTSGLDENLSIKVIKLLNFFSKEKTIIVATHDQSIMSCAKEIYDLSHNELILKNNSETTHKEQLLEINYSDSKINRSSINRDYYYLKNNILYFLSNVVILGLVIAFFLIFLTTIKSNFDENLSTIFGPYTTNTITLSSSDDMNQNYNYDLIEVHENSYYDGNENILNLKDTKYIYEFKQLPVPPSLFNLYNENDITVVGNLPSTENGEILLPDSLCDFDKEKCKSKIGSSINLPLEKGKEGSYVITGFYDTKDDKSEVDYIYTSYNESHLPQEDFKYIVTNQTSETINYIEENCTNCIKTTRQSIKDENSDYYNSVLSRFLIALFLIVVCFLLIYWVIFKKYIIRKIYEKKKLSFLKSSNKNIYFLIFREAAYELILIFIFVSIFINNITFIMIILTFITTHSISYQIYNFNKKGIKKEEY